MRITSKGQVTIPQRVREEAGFLPATEVEFILENDTVMLVKARTSERAGRGAMVIERLRAGSDQISMSTAEILALTRAPE